MLDRIVNFYNTLSSSEIVNLMISGISLIATIFIGYLSYYVARRSLIYSQRSSLIKDSYAPILEDIKLNRSISINSSNKLNFERYYAIKNSYVYLAFDDELKRLSESIFKSEKNINDLKNKLDSISDNVITKILNRELRKNGSDKSVYGVSVEDKSSLKLYDFLIRDQISQSIMLHNQIPLNCEVGEKYVYTEEGIELEGFRHEYRYPFAGFLAEFLKLEVTNIFVANEVISDVEHLEKQMINELKNHPDYKSLESECDKLHKYLDAMEKEIVNRIKELIIPGYRRPKKIFSISKYRNRKYL